MSLPPLPGRPWLALLRFELGRMLPIAGAFVLVILPLPVLARLGVLDWAIYLPLTVPFAALLALFTGALGAGAGSEDANLELLMARNLSRSDLWAASTAAALLVTVAYWFFAVGAGAASSSIIASTDVMPVRQALLLGAAVTVALVTCAGAASAITGRPALAVPIGGLATGILTALALIANDNLEFGVAGLIGAYLLFALPCAAVSGFTLRYRRDPLQRRRLAGSALVIVAALLACLGWMVVDEATISVREAVRGQIKWNYGSGKGWLGQFPRELALAEARVQLEEAIAASDWNDCAALESLLQELGDSVPPEWVQKQLLAPRTWTRRENSWLVSIVGKDSLSPAQKEALFTALAKLIKQDLTRQADGQETSLPSGVSYWAYEVDPARARGLHEPWIHALVEHGLTRCLDRSGIPSSELPPAAVAAMLAEPDASAAWRNFAWLARAGNADAVAAILAQWPLRDDEHSGHRRNSGDPLWRVDPDLVLPSLRERLAAVRDGYVAPDLRTEKKLQAAIAYLIRHGDERGLEAFHQLYPGAKAREQAFPKVTTGFRDGHKADWLGTHSLVQTDSRPAWQLAVEVYRADSWEARLARIRLDPESEAPRLIEEYRTLQSKYRHLSELVVRNLGETDHFNQLIHQILRSAAVIEHEELNALAAEILTDLGARELSEWQLDLLRRLAESGEPAALALLIDRLTYAAFDSRLSNRDCRELLEAATGERHGYDVKAWRTWWRAKYAAPH